MVFIDRPKENFILATLASDQYERLVDDLEFVQLESGQVLYDAGERLGYLYFPTTCIVSLVFSAANGSTAELAIAGNDGLVGIPMVLGGYATTHRAVVQCGGHAYRLRADLARWELDQAGGLQQLSLRYTQALMTQMAQSVVCNRHHSIMQQLCRWLLLSLDRLPGNQLNMTQELIAGMLGVRREAVTEAAGKLRAAGLVQYTRGRITVTDRAGIEAQVCECYAVVKDELDRLSRLVPDDRASDRARPNLAPLRQRAELQLKETGQPDPSQDSDVVRLVHELKVHQIELEMQLEELRSTSGEACALRDRFADIYDFAPVSYFTLSAQGTIIDLNLAAAILLGIKRSEQNKHRFAAFVAPSCLSEFNAFFTEVLTGRSKKVCEITLLPSRQRPEATVRIEAVSDENGQECRMVAIDVSAERQAEKLLAEREHYLRTLLDNFPFMAWLKDDQGHFLATNRAFSAAGLEENEGADDHAVLAGGSGKPVESMIESDGLRRWFETYQAPVQSGELQGMVGFSRDITERKELELALQDSDALKRSILNSVPTAIAVIDGDGVILVVNDHWREFSRENAIDPGCTALRPDVGSNYLAVCQAGIDVMSHGALAAYDGIQAVLSGKLPSFRMEYQCSSPNQKRWYLMTVTPLLQNARDGAVITHTDLTERKLMEMQIREQAFHDPLTKLPNRILFKDRLRHAMASSKRSGRYSALLFLNLDSFRVLNDSHGHEVGDLLLIEVATRLQAGVREMDSVARLGGDEFVVIVNDLDTDKTRATFKCSLIADTICASLGKPYALKIRRGRKTNTVEYCCSASIGVCVFVDHEATPGDILNSAEQAMKQAKGSGRNVVRFHDASLKLASPDLSIVVPDFPATVRGRGAEGEGSAKLI